MRIETSTVVLCLLSRYLSTCHAFLSTTRPALTIITHSPDHYVKISTPIRNTRTTTITSSVSMIPESTSSIETASTFIDSYVHGQYLFMLPTACVVSASCQLAGIGGAAVFSPIFLLVFPLLGPQYLLPSAGAALASALLTEVFGFASGLSGYARRGLVDWKIAGQFISLSIPTALAGALSAKYVTNNVVLLQCLYAALMLGLAAYLTLAPRPEEIEELASEEECDVVTFNGKLMDVRNKKAADGTEFTYLAPPSGSKRSILATAGGASLTGLLGVGIGEVILPQLVRGCCMPLPVAAGTSVAVVVVTAFTAAIVQFLTLAASVSSDGSTTLVEGLVAVVPWNLVKYTIPGVLLGGQIAPFLASRQAFSDEEIETFAATLFAIIGIAFITKVVSGLVV